MNCSVYTNELTNRLVDYAVQRKPDWDRVIARAQQNLHGAKCSTGVLMDAGRGACLRLALEDAVAALDVKKRVKLNALPETKTENYTVKDNNYGKRVIWKHNATQLPIEVAGFVDNFPVIFDIAIESSVFDNRTKTFSLSKLVKEKFRTCIGRIMHPMKELFETDEFGYVLFVSQENYQLQSEALMHFIDGGGRLATLPFTASFFYSELILAGRRHGLVAPKESNMPSTT
jgi:hypothetical protein